MSKRRIVGISMILSMMLLIGACADSDEALNANAGDDFSIVVGQSPTFDGCRSGGDVANYQWVIIEAPDLMDGDSGKVIREIEASCSFTLEAAMEIQEVGTWVLELTVNDAAGNTSVDTVSVEVVP